MIKIVGKSPRRFFAIKPNDLCCGQTFEGKISENTERSIYLACSSILIDLLSPQKQYTGIIDFDEYNPVDLEIKVVYK